MQRLLREARARSLDRIATAYAVAGWLLVQAGSIVIPAFDAPAWTLQAFIVLVVAGFPLALVVGWFAAPRVRLEASGADGVSNREMVLLSLLGAVLLLSAGEFAYVIGRHPGAAGGAAKGPAQASIAVLPFANMSGDPARDVFSDGISEELLNELSGIASLRVAARTSSFAFKGRNEDIKKIAAILNVRNILQGSIREDGTHIRISAQLIGAADGFPLWSATYDREMTGILTLEDEIARAITAALTNRLLGARAMAGKPASIDPGAYRAYLEGQHALAPRTPEGVTRAVALLRRATAQAPDFADGFAALGRALLNEADNHPERKGTLVPDAQTALARALALDPDNINALSVHLDLALHKLDWRTAGVDAARMRAISPNSNAVLHEMFRYYQILGFPDRALDAARGAAALDPLSVVDRLNVAAAAIHVARYGEAAAAAQAALALHSHHNYVEAQLCTAYAHTGRLDEARAIAARFASAGDDDDAGFCRFDIAIGEMRLDDARRIVDGMAARFSGLDLPAADIGDNYAVAGDTQKALAWLERAYDAREYQLFTIHTDRAIAPRFFAEPRWVALTQRPLYRDWRQAHDRLARELAARR
jgi:TolB-like protein/tetratricopeptide (TPR) repeat protein